MTTHDVYITSRQKSRQSTMCIVIKGIEKFITNIYDARHQLLKLTSDRIVGAIPSSYYGPDDMSMFKNSSVSQLLAGPGLAYGPISPIQQIPQITWNVPDINMNSWRSRPAALTSSLLQQHNKMTSNMQLPNRSINDLHSSGYQSFTTESTKNVSHGGSSSVHSSPEQGNFNSKFNVGQMGGSNGFLETSSPQPNRFNDLPYNLDPRIVAGIRAMNTNPSPNEVRVPTPIW